MSESSWQIANRRYLRGALDLVHAHLASGAGVSGATDAAAAQREIEEAAAELPAPSALDTVCASFSLSPFERDLLLMVAGPELDARFPALFAAAHGDPGRSAPTFSLALAALPEAHWSALAPEGALRRWRLIEIGQGAALVSSALRIDERVLHYLVGVDGIDERLIGIIERVRDESQIAPSQQALAERIAQTWSHGHPFSAVQLCGAAFADKLGVAAAACWSVGLELCVMCAHSLPSDRRELDLLMRLCEREGMLGSCALLLECDAFDAADAARADALVSFAEGISGPLLISVGERRPLPRRPVVTLEVGRLSVQEQKELWRKELRCEPAAIDWSLETITSQFCLSASSIRSVAAEAGDAAEVGDELFRERLWEACRVNSRPRLDELAQRIESAAGWNDLVLPETQIETLRDLVSQVRCRGTVYHDWGFAAKSSRGTSITAMFAGVSGTGKSLAAEVVANELKVDLYRIDLSQVVNKYIGETEKNLRRVFDAAEDGAAVLLFDEADALFGKRSEVKDSHDRYANIEVSYLLQRMEAYRGLAILTTNMREALDPAFLRRIRFIVNFPFPDASQRAEIWRCAFPAPTPVEGIDLSRLSRLNVTGGSIRNIALNAAFIAADAAEPVRMGHLLRAARIEYAKLEKPLTASETGDWA